MQPDQIISLMKFEGTDNTFAMGDHDDHIHVGWQPLYGDNPRLATPGQRDPQARPVDQADRPPRRDRQPDRAAQAVEVRAADEAAARFAGARRRVVSPPWRRFGFVQWEFPGRLGPDPGRYVVRRFAGDDVQRILVIDGVDAPRKRRRAARPRKANGGPVGRRGHARDRDRRHAARLARGRRRVARAHARGGRRALRGRRAGAAQPGGRRPPRRRRRAVGRRRRPRARDRVPRRLRQRRAGRRGRVGVRARAAAHASASALRCAAGAARRGARRSRRAAGLRGARRCARAATSTAGARARPRCRRSIALEAALAELEAWRESGDMAGPARRAGRPPGRGRRRGVGGARGGRGRGRRGRGRGRRRGALEAALRARSAGA